MIKAVMFDLDGTLLPTDDNEFTKVYFGLLYRKAAEYGYEKDRFIKTIVKGVEYMRRNDGSQLNSKLFWDVYKSEFGEAEAQKMNPVFDEFYFNEFRQAKVACGENPWAEKIVRHCREKGLKTIVSTSPFFPLQGVVSRLEFIGLKKEDFDYITHYDNTTYSKPSPKFFEEILNNMGLKPEEVLMFGNNEKEDGEPTNGLGMKSFMIGDFIVEDAESNGKYKHLKYEEVCDTIDAELAR